MDQTTPGVAAPAAGGQVPAGQQPPSPTAQATQPAAPAAGSEGTTPSGQPAPAAPAQNVTVPVTVVQALRDELNQAKAQAMQYQQQAEVMRANAAAWQQNQQYVQPQAPPQQPADPFTGLRDDDVLTVADVKKIVERLPSAAHAPVVDNDLRLSVMKLEMAQADPQYETTIRTYLPEVLASDPTLRTVIAASPNPLKTALTLARANPKYIMARSSQQQSAPGAQLSPLDQLSVILNNLEKPGNPGQFGGASVGAGNAGRYAAMSDAEFDAHVKSVKGGV